MNNHLGDFILYLVDIKRDFITTAPMLCFSGMDGANRRVTRGIRKVMRKEVKTDPFFGVNIDMVFIL
jgi:hypothetical protein